MRTNMAVKAPLAYTHEGALAARLTPEQQLRRSVLANLLWENEYYEDGQSIAARIGALVPQVAPEKIAALAIEARTKMHLRHVPLLLMAHLCAVARGTSLVSDTLPQVINRPDEITEFMGIYATVNGVTPNKIKPKLSNQVRKGLARSFLKFSEYSLQKHLQDAGVPIKTKDAMFLVHPKPKDDEQQALWERLIAGKMAVADTWEVALSTGEDKKAAWTRLITDGKLGYLALLRNLRNMEQAGVDHQLVCDAITSRRNGAEKVLPFRFVAAARAAIAFEPALDEALLASIDDLPHLDGKTILLVDVSGSMNAKLSAKSDLTRKDAAAALASIWPGRRKVFSFADKVMAIPPRSGMAGIDAIQNSQTGGTRLFDAIDDVNRTETYDRLVVITDEQAGSSNFGVGIHGKLRSCPAPNGRGYMINVASAKNGVGYGPWVHIDGFSEQVLRWIHEIERPPADDEDTAPGCAVNKAVLSSRQRIV